MAAARQTAERFVEELSTRLGDRLTAAVLFGSVARGEAIPGVSDINLLLLFHVVDAAVLRTAAPAARRWVDAGNTAPLVLTADEWRSASDVFAIEVLDMKDAHEPLLGEDPVAGLEVQRRHLRLQAEREIRGKQVQLREGLLLVADQPSELGRLLLAALPSFTTYLRAALRLAGLPVPADTAGVIRDGCALVAADPTALEETWRARRAGTPFAAGPEDALVTGYYDAVERTAGYIDNLPEETS
jgi:predicted nucleotidyltransferase